MQPISPGMGTGLLKRKSPEGAKEIQASMMLNIELLSPLRGFTNNFYGYPQGLRLGLHFSAPAGLAIFLFVYEAITSRSDCVEVHHIVEFMI